MKLRNKKTGEILGSLGSFIIQNPNHINCEAITKYDSLAELNEEWEDYEEPKTHWYIYGAEPLEVDDGNWDEEFINELEVTGNYFETEEEAKQAVEKLKAWKRLKDSGISFEAKVIGGRWYLGPKVEPKQRTFDEVDDLFKDVMFIFGGKE